MIVKTNVSKIIGAILLVGGFLLSVYNYVYHSLFFKVYSSVTSLMPESLRNLYYIQGWFVSLLETLGIVSVVLMGIGIFLLRRRTVHIGGFY